MSDITKCKGEGCLLAFRCLRFTAPANEFYQSYFSDAPYRIVDEVLKCELFWGLNENENGNEGDNEREVKASEQRGTVED